VVLVIAYPMERATTDRFERKWLELYNGVSELIDELIFNHSFNKYKNKKKRGKNAEKE
jgi:hypothetical protein